MTSVHIKVAEQIAAISPQVEEKVVGVLVGRELDKRSEALVKGHDLLVDAEKTLKGFQPDLRTYDEAGQELSAAWSKSKLGEKKKVTEKVARITNAINQALEGKMDALNKLNKSGGNPDPKDQEEGSTESE